MLENKYCFNSIFLFFSDNQHAFIPFAFDTFGFLTPEADRLLTFYIKFKSHA